MKKVILYVDSVAYEVWYDSSDETIEAIGYPEGVTFKHKTAVALRFQLYEYLCEQRAADMADKASSIKYSF